MAELITTTMEQSTQPRSVALKDKKSTSQAEETCSRSKSKSAQQTTSKSRRSASNSKRRRHNLKRALKRKPRFEDFQERDIKYLYGSEKISNGIEVDPKEFHETAIEYINEHFDYAWTLKAKTKQGFIPVGFVLGVENEAFVNIIEVIWLNWATPRNKLETSLKFLSINRKKYLLTMPSGESAFFNKLMRYGMAHKTGNLMDTELSFYQTRK